MRLLSLVVVRARPSGWVRDGKWVKRYNIMNIKIMDFSWCEYSFFLSHVRRRNRRKENKHFLSFTSSHTYSYSINHRRRLTRDRLIIARCRVTDYLRRIFSASFQNWSAPEKRIRDEVYYKLNRQIVVAAESAQVFANSREKKRNYSGLNRIEFSRLWEN